MCRSPWSNKYDPPLADGAQPSQKLRTLEIQANEAFDIYRDLYVREKSHFATLQRVVGRLSLCPNLLGAKIFCQAWRLISNAPCLLLSCFKPSYFEGGVSSAYLWDLDDGFAGVVLIKKSTLSLSLSPSIPLLFFFIYALA